MKLTAAFIPQTLNVNANVDDLSISTGEQIARKGDDVPEYTGPYSVDPTETEQTLETTGTKMTENVTVGAIPSNYVGSAIPQNDSSDLTVNGKTVTAPAGYYAANATKDVDTGEYKSPLNISIDPTISVNYDTGEITATNTGVKYLHPLQTSGYVLNSTPVTGVFSGNAATQLITIPATTYTPGATAQVIPAQRYLTGDQTIAAVAPPYYDMSGSLAWLGANATLIKTLTLPDVKLSNTSFASWTPSTTATDIQASRNAGTFTATNAANYDYYILWESVIKFEYSSGTVDKAKPLYLSAIHIQGIIRRPSSYPNIQAQSYNNTINASVFTAGNFLRYYGSTQGTLSYTWSTSYGMYGTITAATVSSTTATSPTITCNSPKITARCSTTYMSTSNAALIDQTNTVIKQKCKVYRVEKSSFLQGCYEQVVRLANEVDS